MDAYLFLRELRNRYGRKPVWTDEGVWHLEACRWARLEHRVYPVRWKNLIERMNQALKDRLENFDDLFPCFEEGRDHRHVSNWVGVYRFFHNVIREWGGRPEYQRSIQTISGALARQRHRNHNHAFIPD